MKENSRDFFQNVKNIVILSFGSFGLNFMLLIYILTTSRLLIERSVSITLSSLFLFSEIMIFAFAYPFFNYLYDITRSAIGRRTPYLIIFGILAALNLTLIQKLSYISIFSLLMFIALFNFWLFLYTIAFFGMIKDKILYHFRNIMVLNVKLWGIVGSISAYLYMLNSDKVQLGVETPVGGFLFLISALTVAFFIVEDKKYKVPLSRAEKPSYNYNVIDTFRFYNLGVKDIKKAMLFSLIYIYEFFILNFLKDSSFKVISINLLVFLLGTILAYFISLFSGNFGTIVREKKIQNSAIIILSIAYLVFNYANIKIISGIQFFVGFLWGIILLNQLGYIIPGKSERFTIYLMVVEDNPLKPDTKKLEFFFLTFIFIIVLSSILDIVGVQNVSLVYSIILFSILILEK